MLHAPDAAIDEILRGEDLATFKGVQAIAPILIPERNAVTVEEFGSSMQLHQSLVPESSDGGKISKVARHCPSLHVGEN